MARATATATVAENGEKVVSRFLEVRIDPAPPITMVYFCRFHKFRASLPSFHILARLHARIERLTWRSFTSILRSRGRHAIAKQTKSGARRAMLRRSIFLSLHFLPPSLATPLSLALIETCCPSVSQANGTCPVICEDS